MGGNSGRGVKPAQSTALMAAVEATGIEPFEQPE